MPIGFHFDPRELGRLARDFEVAEGGLLPRLRIDMVEVGKRARDQARSRFIRYAGDDRTIRTTVEGFKSTTGIFRDGSGVYASVGQTLPRNVNRPKPLYTHAQLVEGLEPQIEPSESRGRVAMEEGSVKVFRSRKLM